MQNEKFFMMKTACTKVPVELRRRVYDALANVPGRPQDLRDICDTFNTAPTFEDFCAVLRDSKNNSSAGLTECSYNQLKHWPTDLLRSTYDGLVACWERKQYLPDWKRRWLKELAKQFTAVISSVGDLRPIIYVEALRKI